MEQCKRMLVQAYGVALGSQKYGIAFTARTAYATNYNPGTCSGEEGKCGCIHAEMALLEKMPDPFLVFVSSSPCLDCAKALVSAGVRRVVYQTPYRLEDGIKYLEANGVQVHCLDISQEHWDIIWHNAKQQR